MIELTEPQVWVLIGVFAAAFFSMIGIVTTNFHRTMAARFKTVDTRFEGLIGRFDARFESMETRFDAMEARVDARFEVINVKLENMDRDIQALSRRVFGTDTP